MDEQHQKTYENTIGEYLMVQNETFNGKPIWQRKEGANDSFLFNYGME